MSPGHLEVLPSPAHIERLAHSILARPEFRRHATDIVDRVLGTIGGWIEDLFSRLASAAGHGGAGAALSAAVVLVVLAGATWLVWWSLRSIRRSPDRGEKTVTSEEGALDAPAWFARADQAERSGDYPQALRCRYRASVSALASRGLLNEQPNRTAGDYRKEVLSALPDCYPDFAALSDAFESAWYGGAEVSLEQAIQAAELAWLVVGRAGDEAAYHHLPWSAATRSEGTNGVLVATHHDERRR